MPGAATRTVAMTRGAISKLADRLAAKGLLAIAQTPGARGQGLSLTEAGRTLVGIAMATAQGPIGNFYYDQKTALLARLETFVQAGASGQLKVVADFADYRQVGGIKVAFKVTLTNPAICIVTDVESVDFNEPLEDAFFEPRREL